jgi:hypothetical protein
VIAVPRNCSLAQLCTFREGTNQSEFSLAQCVVYSTTTISYIAFSFLIGKFDSTPISCWPPRILDHAQNAWSNTAYPFNLLAQSIENLTEKLYSFCHS